MRYLLFLGGIMLLGFSYLAIYTPNLDQLKDIAPLIAMIAGFVISDSFEDKKKEIKR